MGNGQSAENTDVYTYHETVLKQGAAAVGSSSSDESGDEGQEADINITDESDSNDESGDSMNQTSASGSSPINEDVKIEPATNSNESREGGKKNERDSSEFVTPPSSRESSPVLEQRQTQSGVLRASTLSAVVNNKRPRFSMRDSDDSDEDTNNNASSEIHIDDRSIEAQSSAECPQTSVHSTQNESQPGLQASEASRPTLKAKRNVQMLKKNAIRLQKILPKPTTSISNPPQSFNNIFTNNQSSGISSTHIHRAENSITGTSVTNTCSIEEQNSTSTQGPNTLPSSSVQRENSVSTLEDNSATSSQRNNSSEIPADAKRNEGTSIDKNTSNNAASPSDLPVSTTSDQNLLAANTNLVSSEVTSENINVARTSNSLISTRTERSTISSRTKETESIQTPPSNITAFSEVNSDSNDVDMRDVSSEQDNIPKERENIFLQPGPTSLKPQTSEFGCQASFESSKSEGIKGTYSAEVQTLSIPESVFQSNGSQNESRQLDRNTETSSSLLASPGPSTSSTLQSFTPTINPLYLIEAVQSISQLASLESLSQESETSSRFNNSMFTSSSTSRMTPNPVIQSSRSPAYSPLNPIRDPVPKVAMAFPSTSRSATAILAVQDKLSFPIANNFTLTIKLGDITKQDTAVIVNSTDRNLRHQGALSRSIAESASPQMVYECQRYLQNYGGQLDVLHVLDTCAGGRLDPKVERIVHVVPPVGADFDQFSVNKLINAYLQCMLHSDRVLNSSSITFPLLGAGSFPTDVSINAFYNAVLIFQSEKRVGSNLNDVRLAINDKPIFQFTVDYFTSCYETILSDGIDATVADALDSFYGNQKNNFSSYRVKEEADSGSVAAKSKWSPANTFRNFFSGPQVKRPRL